MNILFKVLLLLGVGFIIYNVVVRPENAFLFNTLGVLLSMSAGFMVIKTNKSTDV